MLWHLNEKQVSPDDNHSTDLFIIQIFDECARWFHILFKILVQIIYITKTFFINFRLPTLLMQNRSVTSQVILMVNIHALKYSLFLVFLWWWFKYYRPVHKIFDENNILKSLFFSMTWISILVNILKQINLFWFQMALLCLLFARAQCKWAIYCKYPFKLFCSSLKLLQWCFLIYFSSLTFMQCNCLNVEKLISDNDSIIFSIISNESVINSFFQFQF